MADPIIIKPIDLKPAKNYQGSLPFNNDCCAPLFPEESATPTPTPSSVTQTPTPTPTLTPTPTIIPPTPEPSASRPAATPTPTPTSTSLGPCKLNTWYLSTTYVGENLSIEGLVSGACRVSSGAATSTPTLEEHWYLSNSPQLDDPCIESYQIFEPAASIALGKTSLWSGQEVNRTLFTQGERVYINYPVNHFDSRYSGYYYITNIENIVPDPVSPPPTAPISCEDYIFKMDMEDFEDSSNNKYTVSYDVYKEGIDKPGTINGPVLNSSIKKVGNSSAEFTLHPDNQPRTININGLEKSCVTPSQDFTIQFWINISKYDGRWLSPGPPSKYYVSNNIIFSNIGGAKTLTDDMNGNFSISLEPLTQDAETNYVISYSKNPLGSIQNPQHILINTWYHVAISRVNQVTRLFINGNHDETNIIAGEYILGNPDNRTTTRKTSIGFPIASSVSERPALHFKGYIDQFEIISKGLYQEDFSVDAIPYLDCRSSSEQSNITRTRISLSCTRTSSCIGLEDSSPDLYLFDNIEPELVIATTEDGKTFKKKHSFEIERVQFGPGTYRFICGYTIDKEDLDNVISSQDNNSGILTVNTDYAKKIRAIIAPDGPTNLITIDTSEATEVDGSGYFVGLIKVTVPQASSLPDDPNKSIFITLETIDYNTHIDRIFYDPSCPNQLHPTATPTPTSSGPAPSPTPTPSFTPTVTPTLTSTPSPTPTTSSADPLTRAWDFSKTLIWGIEGRSRKIRRAPEYDPSGGGNNGREASKNLWLIGADKGDGVYPPAEWYSTTWLTAKDDQGGNMQSRVAKFNVGETVNIYYPGGPAHPTLGVQGTNKNYYHKLSGRRGETTRPNIIDQELSTLTVRKFERLRAEDPLNLTNEDVIRVWFYRTPPEPPPPEFGEGIIIKFETNAPLADPNFYVKLTPNTPITNNNFLEYVTRGDYDNTFFHRSIEDFIIQGGMAKTPINNSDQPNSDPVLVPNRGSIRNEPFNKNTIGTIAMSKIAGQPDSATNQFYFNLDNNHHLNSDSGGYTVFGHVLSSDNNNTIRDGMILINLLGSQVTFDASNYYANFSKRENLKELPFWFDNTPPGNIVKPSDFLQIKKVSVFQGLCTKAWDFQRTVLWRIQGLESGAVLASDGTSNSSRPLRAIFLYGTNGTVSDDQKYGAYWYATNEFGGNMENRNINFRIGEKVRLSFAGENGRGQDIHWPYEDSGQSRPSYVSQALRELTVREYVRNEGATPAEDRIEVRFELPPDGCGPDYS